MAWIRQIKYKAIMTKEGSAKIVNTGEYQYLEHG